MFRLIRATLLALTALSLVASLAFAASVHFKGAQERSQCLCTRALALPFHIEVGRLDSECRGQLLERGLLRGQTASTRWAA